MIDNHLVAIGIFQDHVLPVVVLGEPGEVEKFALSRLRTPSASEEPESDAPDSPEGV